MGYRNDVAIVVRADEGGGANIVRLWNAYVEQHPRVVEALDWADEYDCNPREWRYRSDGIPWYEQDGVVVLVERWLDTASEVVGVSMTYVRIGDDLDDVETRWSGTNPPQLGVARTITGW